MRPTDDLRTWAAAYREAGRPSDAVRARVLHAVRHADENDVHPRPRERGWSAWGIGLGVGALLGAAALLLLSWTVRWMRPELEPSSAPTQAPLQRSKAAGDAATSRAGASSEARAPSHGAASPEPEPETPTAAPPVADSSPPAPAIPPRASGSSSPAAGERETPTATPPPEPQEQAAASSVDLESLRRLRAAEQLLAGDPSRARALVEAHARDYPKSALALEREALWIRAACRSGGASGLERRRAAFATWPGVAAYLAAIERDCER